MNVEQLRHALAEMPDYYEVLIDLDLDRGEYQRRVSDVGIRRVHSRDDMPGSMTAVVIR